MDRSGHKKLRKLVSAFRPGNEQDFTLVSDAKQASRFLFGSRPVTSAQSSPLGPSAPMKFTAPLGWSVLRIRVWDAERKGD